MVSERRKRVAIVGASGIGKHHAKWWNLEGAEVCAFVGTSEESMAKTRDALIAMLPFTGRGYLSLDQLISTESPDIIDVCSPPALHFNHACRALEAGVDVLCEKPFVYDKDLSLDELMAQAQALVALADRQGRQIGICTQYTVCARHLKEMWETIRPGAAITRFEGRIESPARGREPDPSRVWVDLAPHPLSVMQALFPGANLDWSTLATVFDGYDAHASFTLIGADNSRVNCDITVRNLEGGGNLRRFVFDDVPFQIEGENDAQGVYNARIETPSGARIAPDMMRLLIRDFLAGHPSATGTAGVDNLELLLGILSASRKV